jgi:flagellin
MITINTNAASMSAAFNLAQTNASLQKSLNRLSSGSRINSSSDDSGGLAVSMKLTAAIRRTEATQANVNNSLSFLETQDGVLKSADKVLSRMAELVQLSSDVTKSTADRSLYQTEFQSLQAQLQSMQRESFNGVSLFTAGDANTTIANGTLAVVASQDGTQTIGASQLDFAVIREYVGTASGDMLNNAAGMTLNNVFQNITTAAAAITTINSAIQSLAALRATNGSEQVRLTFASDMLSINKVTLDSANSRITDVDIAVESANLARLNILQQAGTAMLSQANMSTQSVLRLLA